MRIIDNIKNKMKQLPGIRSQNQNQLTLADLYNSMYGWSQMTSNKPTGDFELYFQAGNNVYVNRSIQVIIDTLLGTGFEINNLDENNINIPRTQYLKNIFNNPLGYSNELTFAMFHNQYLRSFLLTGDAFIEVKENTNFDNIVEGFEFIPPELMFYDTHTDQWGIRNTQIRYEPEQLIHIYEPQIRLKILRWGTSKIDTIGTAIALMYQGMKHNRQIVGNDGLDPNAILTFDKDTNNETFTRELQRINAERKQNPNGTLVLKGASFEQGGLSNKDMDFMNLMIFARDQIITGYGVQPSKLGIKETASLGTGTGESQDKDFKDMLNGVTRLIEDGFNKVLGRHGFQETFHYGDLDIENKLQRAQIEDIQLKNGTLLVNEVRNNYGLEPVPHGDVPMDYSRFGVRNTNGVENLEDANNPPLNTISNINGVKKLTNNEIRKSINNLQKYKTELYTQEMDW